GGPSSEGGGRQRGGEGCSARSESDPYAGRSRTRYGGDPENGNRDEAEGVDEDPYEDGIAVRQRLNRLTRDVRNGEAQPEDRHDGSEDAVRERFDPRLPQSRDGAALRAHGFAEPSPQ